MKKIKKLKFKQIQTLKFKESQQIPTVLFNFQLHSKSANQQSTSSSSYQLYFSNTN